MKKQNLRVDEVQTLIEHKNKSEFWELVAKLAKQRGEELKSLDQNDQTFLTRHAASQWNLIWQKLENAIVRELNIADEKAKRDAAHPHEVTKHYDLRT